MDTYEIIPQKIVIAEDNAALADIYKTRLELLGYQCFAAYDGQEALEIIEREKPALVLLDLMMPRVAGDEVLRRMRETEDVLQTSALRHERADVDLRAFEGK